MTVAGWIIGIGACVGWAVLIFVVLAVLGINTHRAAQGDWFADEPEEESE